LKYRKKTLLLEATQWFKNGDHPQDESEPLEHSAESAKLTEGKVVQYYPSLEVSENRFCPDCGNLMQRHGVLNGNEIVCPGDYIVTDRKGLNYRLSRGEFESQYELYAPPPRPAHTERPLSDLEELKLRRRTERPYAREMRRKSADEGR
jgi:hypothetical protein